MCSNGRLPFVGRQVAESSHCTAEGLPVRCSTPSNPFATLEHLFCIGFQGQADSSTAQSTLVVGSALVRQCSGRKRVANWPLVCPVTACSQSPMVRSPRSKDAQHGRSEEHTSELQSLMRISYAVFCLKKKKNKKLTIIHR